MTACAPLVSGLAGGLQAGETFAFSFLRAGRAAVAVEYLHRPVKSFQRRVQVRARLLDVGVTEYLLGLVQRPSGFEQAGLGERASVPRKVVGGWTTQGLSPASSRGQRNCAASRRWCGKRARPSPLVAQDPSAVVTDSIDRPIELMAP